MSDEEQPIDDKFLFSDDRQGEAVSAALGTRQLSGTCRVVEEYEGRLAAYFRTRHAIAVNSGSAAIHTALYAAGVTEGSEVLIPATAPIPSALPILTAKAIPVAVDVTANGLGFEPTDLASKITSRTKAALAVPLWGYPIDYSETIPVLAESEVPLIEDACQAHGTVIHGKFAGTIGLVGCFSTHDRKLLSTGEGGYLLTDSDEVSRIARRFTRLGDLDGIHHGMNYKINGLSAALGSYRLGKLDAQLMTRRENARRVLDRVHNTLVVELPVPDGCRPNYYVLTLLVRGNGQEAIRIATTLARRGIRSDHSKYGYRAIYQQPLFRAAGHRCHCPNAERLIEGTIQIPVHPSMIPADLEWIAAVLNGAIR